MAGNCNVACAEAHFSLAKERARVDPKTLPLVPIPQFDAFPLSQGRGAKRKRLHQFDLTRPSTRSSQPQHPVAGWSRKPFKLCVFRL